MSAVLLEQANTRHGLLELWREVEGRFSLFLAGQQIADIDCLMLAEVMAARVVRTGSIYPRTNVSADAPQTRRYRESIA